MDYMEQHVAMLEITTTIRRRRRSFLAPGYDFVPVIDTS